ncbi:methionyl-tRNA formyltransferase [Haloferula chungangensis]|uniref:Methionyl-tRNA formyltransferase n=1 Tax=Haloferula chungangensis TaxID=1048331 RepID=A0ABW2L686_9BACT
MENPRIVFLGTGEIAIPAFRFLIEEGFCPVALVTQPDRPAGRRRELKPPPIKEVALAVGMTVLQPERVKEESTLEAIEALKPDLIVVMAYGQILPKRLIGMAPLGCVNLHASLLPKYRGAACIQAAIDAGDSVTGVTLMHVVPKLDAGDVILAKETPINDDDTGGSLHDRLAELARDALKAGLPSLLDGTAASMSQESMGEISHISKLDREDGRIDWSWSAPRIERRLRAYDPWPGCYTTYADGAKTKRLKIFPAGVCAGFGEPGEVTIEGGQVRVACGEGLLVLGHVQADGSRRMAAIDWSRGWQGESVTRLD